MKVVHLLPELNSGGVEQVVLELSAGLVKRGVENIVISAGGRLLEQLEQEGSRHIRMNIGKKGLGAFFRIRPLRRLLNSLQPDIIHLHSRVPAWLGYYAWQKLPQESRPGLITTVHGFYSVNRYSAVMCRGERIIAVSGCVKDYIVQNYPSTQEKCIRIIPNTISQETHYPGYAPLKEWVTGWYMSHPELKGKFTICLPGRITRLKGQLDLVPIIRKLRELGVPAHAVIVGEAKKGKESYKHEVEQAARRAGVTDSFTWVGHRRDLRNVLSFCDVTISLSQQPEAFGKTTLEALALGKPVAGYAHGGVKEQLDAFLPQGNVPVKDIDGMARLLEQWYRNPPAPVQDIPSPYHVEDMIDNHLQVYHELKPHA